MGVVSGRMVLDLSEPEGIEDKGLELVIFIGIASACVFTSGGATSRGSMWNEIPVPPHMTVRTSVLLSVCAAIRLNASSRASLSTLRPCPVGR